MDRDFNVSSYMDYNGFNNFNNSQNQNSEINDFYKDFNPMSQYEQAYIYYKALCMQMDYKIKCKEYEKLCNTNSSIKTT